MLTFPAPRVHCKPAGQYLVRLFQGLALVLATAGPAVAQSYPDHPIKWIVPFAPGGGGDTTARLVAREAEKLVGQPFVIDNRPGAATILGMQALLASPSDGYTVFSGNDSLATNLYLMDKVPYKLDDVLGISVISKSPLALVTRPDFPAKDLNELMQQIKAGNVQFTLPYVPFTQGAKAAQSLLDAIAGKTVPRFIPEWKDATPEKPTIVTKENIDSFVPEF